MSVVALTLGACTVTEDDAPPPAPTAERYASGDATRLGAGIFEWWVTSIDDEMRVQGIDRDGDVEVEYSVRLASDVIEIEMVFPETGSVSFDPTSGTMSGELPRPELFQALGSDLEAYGDADVVPRSHNTWTCWAAIAAEVVACLGGPNPACLAAAAAALAACTGEHCDQIQCNARCTAGGHTYGWCESDSPTDCVCHGNGPAGGGGGGAGPGGGGPSGGGGGCHSDWDCPNFGYCIAGTCS